MSMQYGIDVGDLCDGQLLIDSLGSEGWVPMRCPGWYIGDLTPLWPPGPKRGQNRLIPHAMGLITNPKRVTEKAVSLSMGIVGEADVNGNVNVDVWVGYQRNIDYLTEWVVDDPTAQDTRGAQLFMPDGTVRVADIQVQGLQLGRALDGHCIATLDLLIPAGRFV